LVHRPEDAGKAPVAAFRDWLLDEAGRGRETGGR
jgi:hypothetical protein